MLRVKHSIAAHKHIHNGLEQAFLFQSLLSTTFDTLKRHFSVLRKSSLQKSYFSIVIPKPDDFLLDSLLLPYYSIPLLSINCAKRFYFFKPDSDVIFHSISLAHTHNHKRARGATRSKMLLASFLSREQQLKA